MKVLINGCSHSKVGFSVFENDDRSTIYTVPEQIIKSWQWYFAKLLKINNLLSIVTKPNAPKICPDTYRKFVPIEFIFEYGEDDCIISLASDGKGNDSILFDTLYALRGFESRGEKIDLVIIQFSGPSRRLVSTDVDDLAYANPHENFEFGVNFEPVGSLLTLHSMLVLQDFLKRGNYNYFFLNYFSLDRRIETQNVYNELDLSKFITYKDKHPIFDGWLEHIKNDGLSIDEFGHPNLELMELISKSFFDKLIDTRNII